MIHTCTYNSHAPLLYPTPVYLCCNNLSLPCLQESCSFYIAKGFLSTPQGLTNGILLDLENEVNMEPLCVITETPLCDLGRFHYHCIIITTSLLL